MWYYLNIHRILVYQCSKSHGCVYNLLQSENVSSQKKNRSATVITVASIGFALLGLTLLMVGYLAYRRHHQ